MQQFPAAVSAASTHGMFQRPTFTTKARLLRGRMPSFAFRNTWYVSGVFLTTWAQSRPFGSLALRLLRRMLASTGPGTVQVYPGNPHNRATVRPYTYPSREVYMYQECFALGAPEKIDRTCYAAERTHRTRGQRNLEQMLYLTHESNPY